MKHLKKYLLIMSLLLPIILDSSKCFGAGILLQLKPGTKYVYEFSAKINSEMNSFDLRSHIPWETKKKLTISVLAFRSGVYVLDLSDGSNTVRRYIKPNYSILLSPTEKFNELPVVIKFPENGIEIGAPKQITTQITYDNKYYNVFWKYICEKMDQPEYARLKFQGSVVLPNDKIISRELKLEGETLLNIKTGLPMSGEWKISYSLGVSNKELAVIRPLWNYRETRVYSMALEGEQK